MTLRGLAPPHVGVERRVLSPFDRLEPIERRSRPRFVARRAWRRACAAAIVDAAPPDGLRSAVAARIDLLPYQLEPALAVVRGLGCRLLLADEVGLGKTIQAGLIVGELRARGVADRVLVLTPAGLRDQWQAELRDRFGLASTVVDARTIREVAAMLPPDVDPWSTFATALVSIDYMKRADVFAAAARRPWDLVIVDEAHGAASDSDRRAAVDALCARAAYMVLLTATPHNGDRDCFASLCRLGRVGDDRLLVFRRGRGDAGLPVARRVRTLLVRPSRRERRLHDALRRYTNAVIAERPQAWLALSVLHKRALSSAAALAESVERRLAAIDARADEADAPQLDLPLDASGETTRDDEQPAWAAGLRLANAADERKLLAALAHAARLAAQRESKIAAIARLLRRVRESILVFTEYRDTLRHLQRAIRRPTILLHGGLARDERRAAVEAFTRASGAVMLATDAAGEGLNLHATCRLVVNLELPWNPMRLEQRIGRVDRAGQRRVVHAIHLVARQTGETALLAQLRARVSRARADIGAPDPFGAGEERAAAEVVILRRSTSGGRVDAADVAGTYLVDVVESARVEASRLAGLRRLADAIGARPAAAVARPLAMRARGRLRRRLTGRRLEIWRLTADDNTGRRAATGIVALLIRGGRDVDVGPVIDAAVRAWSAHTDATVAAFASTRLGRVVAVLEQEDRHPTGLDQAPLFSDRRRAREQLASAAERAELRAALAARIADARAAAPLAARDAELLAVVVP